MKTYKCVFDYANGRSTLGVEAENAERALAQAVLVITSADVVNVEIWDETGLVWSGRSHPTIKIANG